jgi:hypothetical protein
MACAPGGVLTGDATIVQAPPALPIARNTALLSAALAAHSAMGQLAVAVASITLVRVIDVDRLLGLGPAVVLAAGALAAIPAGRSMDRFGRVPVLAAGFGVGAAGCGLAALGSALDSVPTVLAGLVDDLDHVASTSEERPVTCDYGTALWLSRERVQNLRRQAAQARLTRLARSRRAPAGDPGRDAPRSTSHLSSRTTT